jgi:hypothetical protein
LWLAGAGLLAALALRRWRPVALALWMGLMLLAVAPNLIGLPGAGVIDTFAVYIALYLPLTPLAGYALGVGQRLAQRWMPRLTPLAASVVVMAGGVWGYGWQAKNIYAPETQLFTPADARAVEWIQTNTSSEARFFVNAFPVFDGTLIAGNDGGWWLPLLTGRETNVPPITYGSERGLAPDYYEQVSGLAVAMRGRPLTDTAAIAIDLTMPANYARLVQGGFSYIYLGAVAEAKAGSADWIDPATLIARPDQFTLVYDQEGVRIFELAGARP